MKPAFLFGILGYCDGSITLSHLWPVGVPSSRLLNLFDMTLVVSVVSYFGVKQDVLGYFFAPDLEPLLFFPLCFSCLHLEQDARTVYLSGNPAVLQERRHLSSSITTEKIMEANNPATPVLLRLASRRSFFFMHLACNCVTLQRAMQACSEDQLTCGLA